MAENEKELLEHIGGEEYKYGFTTQIDTELIRKGLDEEVVRLISAKKGEPAWMTERRVAAYRHWLTLDPPETGMSHAVIRKSRRTTAIKMPPQHIVSSLAR